MKNDLIMFYLPKSTEENNHFIFYFLSSDTML